MVWISAKKRTQKRSCTPLPIQYLECDEQTEDHRPHISRIRRTPDREFSIRSDGRFPFPSINDLHESDSSNNSGESSRFESLESVVEKSRKIKDTNLKRNLNPMSTRVAGSGRVDGNNNNERVCVDFEGELRSENEIWIHSNDAGDKCAECRCQVFPGKRLQPKINSAQ